MDLILSSTYGLPASALLPFCESLLDSGYCGRRIMVTYDRDDQRDRYLVSCGWQLAPQDFPADIHPFIHRFMAYQAILRQFPDVSRVLACDSRDLVFQLNPSDWLRDAWLADSGEILLASEELRIRHEPWISGFIQANFPDYYDDVADCLSVCAGTIAGTAPQCRHLFGLLWRFSVTGAQHLQKPCDQPALNILHNTGLLAALSPRDDFACTAGTLLDPKFDAVRTSPRPTIDGPLVLHPGGRPYLLLHQYDRIPALRDAVLSHYVRPPRPEPDKPGTYQGAPTIPIRDRSLQGKIVALVGPSPSLRHLGPEIDSADLVVRMNRALLGDGPDPPHQGARTDILYHCLHQSEECGGPIPFDLLAQSDIELCSPYPRHLLPFHQDACAFFHQNIPHHLRYRFIDLDFYLAIAHAVGTRPNTGLLAICELLSRHPKELRLYGFTFFRDGHAPRYKTLPAGTLDQWRTSDFNGNHHQEPQRLLLRDLCASHPITPDPTLADILAP